MSESPLFLVFDVESVGLYGDGFAVGWVVIDLDGKEHESGLLATDWTEFTRYDPFDARWVRNNVPPMPITHKHVDDLRSEFFNVIQRWHINSDEAYRHHPKAHSFWADWGYPVEARFLADCRHTGFWKANASYRSVVEIPRHAMPAPLQEIATICLAADINPDDFPCLPDELPQHNPMNDARHSARLLVKALAKLREQRQLATETLMRH